MKKVICMLLAAVMLFSLTACSKDGGKDGDGPVKIGYTSYLSGALAAYMVWSRAGVNMAVQEFNDNGGINGRKVELAISTASASFSGGIWTTLRLPRGWKSTTTSPRRSSGSSSSPPIPPSTATWA